MRLFVVAHVLAKRTVEAVDRQEGEAVDLDEVAHALDIHLRGKKLGAFRRVDAVEAAVPRRRRGDAHVHLGGAGLAHHLHDLEAGGAAHDRIVDQDDAPVRDQRAIGVVLQLYTEVADVVGRLDECAADILGPEQADFPGEAGGAGILLSGVPGVP